MSKEYGNFIELFLVDEANKVDLNEYRLIEGLSAKKGMYCFIKRAKVKK